MGNNLTADLQQVEPGIRIGNIRQLADYIKYKSGASTQNAITASTTQTQAGGTQIYYHIARVTTANANDAVTLNYAAVPGASFVIINDSGNIVTLFPRLGDTLNDAVHDAGITLADNTVSKYYCPVAGLWFGGAVTLET